MKRLTLAAAFLLGLVPCVQLRAEEWPQFRGPTGLGYTTAKNLPLKWDGKTGENVRWKCSLEGEGHASPIVWGDRIFVCHVAWPISGEERKKMPEHRVSCFRADDGKRLWQTVVPPGPWLRNDFRSGPGGGYAAPTPATDGKLVYCVFGSAVMSALDFEGKIAWRHEIVPHSFDVTIGTSPILYGDTLLFLCALSSKKDSRLAAFRKSDGTLKWEQKLPAMGFAHSTPVLVEIDGKPQLIVLASGSGNAPDALQSLDPTDGKRLWWCRGVGEASSPAFSAGKVYFDSGRGGPGTLLSAGGSGDISEQIVWTVGQVPEAIGSPIIVGDYVYRVHTPGILKCWKLTDGKEVYAKRLEGLSSTWSSPLANAAGRIYLASGGKSYVLKAGPEGEILAENDLGDPNHATPAVWGERLIIVGQKQIYCVGNP